MAQTGVSRRRDCLDPREASATGNGPRAGALIVHGGGIQETSFCNIQKLTRDLGVEGNGQESWARKSLNR